MSTLQINVSAEPPGSTADCWISSLELVYDYF